MTANDPKAAELAAMVREIRERVLERYPSVEASGLRLADLTPVIEARDAAQGKVAAIGTVNPRPPGLANNLAQSVKKLVARALRWHVREQVEYNAALIRCIDALIEAHIETNRALAAAGARAAVGEKGAQEFAVWADQQTATEVRFLRSITETETATRAYIDSTIDATAKTAADTALERERQLSENFHSALARATDEIQTRLWKDLEKTRFETMAAIHQELRLLRQRASAAPEAILSAAPVPAGEPKIDWMLFAEKFRGPEEKIKAAFLRYAPKFEGAYGVLDLGCGRGEFLEVMREAGIRARGVDLSAANTSLCRAKSLDAVERDFFEYLAELPDRSVGGIFCAQVIEHLPPERVPELVRLCARKLRAGAPVLFETPNPECLAIFATHFYLDPTHVRPVPPALMFFYLEEAGFLEIDVERFAPASDDIRGLSELPAGVRDGLFGFLDYAIYARSAS